MVQLTEITSPPRVSRSAPEHSQESAPQRRSSSMPAATLGLQGRAVVLQTKPEDSGPPPTRRPPPLKPSKSTVVPHRESAVSGTEVSPAAARAAALAEARAGKAAAVTPPGGSAPPVTDTAEWRNMAAAGILKMEGYVGEAEKSATENQAALQTRIQRLQSMADLKADVLRFQTEMRKQIEGVEDQSDPACYATWAQAVKVNLEAVFQKAEAEVAAQPPARSLEAERIGLDFRPSGAASHQENGLVLKNKISHLEELQKSRAQFSSSENAKIEQALDDLRGRMKELKEHLREKGIPESLFFRKPTPRHEIEAARERSRREAQEALDLGHYTF